MSAISPFAELTYLSTALSHSASEDAYAFLCGRNESGPRMALSVTPLASTADLRAAPRETRSARSCSTSSCAVGTLKSPQMNASTRSSRKGMTSRLGAC
eukprot:1723290-Prymnesium_polylepis.1